MAAVQNDLHRAIWHTVEPNFECDQSLLTAKFWVQQRSESKSLTAVNGFQGPIPKTPTVFCI